MSVLLEILSVSFWFVVILIPLVVLHEFGHLLLARLNGVRVVEFGVGIPPRLAFGKWRGIIWSLNWVLLGGFAKIYGDHDALDEANEQRKINPELAKSQYLQNRLGEIVTGEELQFFLEDNGLVYDNAWAAFDKACFVSSPDASFGPEELATYRQQQHTLETLIGWEFDTKLGSKKAFFNKALWQKISILLGGVGVNLLTALLIFLVFYGVTGTPLRFVPFDELEEYQTTFAVTAEGPDPIVGGLDPAGAAYAAGVRPGDTVVSLDETSLRTLPDFAAFAALVEQSRGRAVPLVYRDGESGDTRQTTLNLTSTGDTQNFGVSAATLAYPVTLRARSFPQALSLAGREVGTTFTQNFAALGRLVRAPFVGDSEAAAQIGGPILIGRLGNQIYALQGVKGVFNAMALVSVSLAAFNLLPLPALDGGRVVILLLNTFTKKRNKARESLAISLTMLALLALGVLVALKDLGLVF